MSAIVSSSANFIGAISQELFGEKPIILFTKWVISCVECNVELDPGFYFLQLSDLAIAGRLDRLKKTPYREFYESNLSCRYMQSARQHDRMERSRSLRLRGTLGALSESTLYSPIKTKYTYGVVAVAVQFCFIGSFVDP